MKERGPGFIRGDARCVGVSLATEDAQWYFPFAHTGGDNMPLDDVLTFLRTELRHVEYIIGMNIQYDMESLWSVGVDLTPHKLIDVQVTEALLDEENPGGYSLDAIARRRGLTQKNHAVLDAALHEYGLQPGDIGLLPARYVGAYAEHDARLTYDILQRQLPVIDAENLKKVWEVECRLIPVLWLMRLRGIPVDLHLASELSREVKAEEDKLRDAMYRKYGAKIDEWSAPALAKICERLEIDVPRTEKDNPSFKDEFITNHNHPFLKDLADLRELNRLRNVFIDEWIFGNEVHGVIHPRWIQLKRDEGGTRTGRLAASDPNPQQLPANKHRDGTPNPIGQKIRSMFRAQGSKWGKFDYSQQEPRILTHYAAMCKHPGAMEIVDAYRANKDMDFYDFLVKLANITRRQAKDMVLGRCYGMGKDKMAAKLNRSVEECEKLLASFDERVPFVKFISDQCMNIAKGRGYIKTILGRRRRFNLFEPITGGFAGPLDKVKAENPQCRVFRRAHTHKALNALIQGSAADMTKAAMVRIYESGHGVPYMQLHDELNYPLTTEIAEQHGNILKELMETAVELLVPVKADMKIGDHWQ